MQTGTRGAQRPAPGNVTGMRFYRQQREQDAKRKLAEQRPEDIAEIRKAAWRDGFDAGYIAGWDALASVLVEEGILMPDEDQGDQADNAQRDENAS
jgi:hypothetical protein